MKNTFLILLFAVSCVGYAQKKTTKFEVQKSEAQWKKELTQEEYEVIREKGN